MRPETLVERPTIFPESLVASGAITMKELSAAANALADGKSVGNPVEFWKAGLTEGGEGASFFVGIVQYMSERASSAQRVAHAPGGSAL